MGDAILTDLSLTGFGLKFGFQRNINQFINL